MQASTITEEARRRPLLVAGIVACLAMVLVMRSVGCLIASRAEAQVVEVQTVAADTNVVYERLIARTDDAKKEHNPRYLEKFEIASIEANLTSANDKLKAADETENPTDKSDLAEEAKRLLAQVNKEIKERSAYLDLLDQAKREFPAKLAALDKSILNNKSRIGELTVFGFFSTHFTAAEKLNTEARDILERAERLQPSLLSGELPDEKTVRSIDYLRIWQTANDGLRVSGEAGKLIARISTIKEDNEHRLREVLGKQQKTSELYSKAFAAAQRLEQYPTYRCLDEVNKANLFFSNLTAQFRDANYRNSMALQEFEAVAAEINQIDQRLANADRTFVAAIDRWRDVQQAQSTLSGKRKSAFDAVERARAEIQDYDYNNQNEAEGLLRDARVSLRDAGNLETIDPIESVRKFTSTIAKANQAHDAVDTRSRRSSSQNAWGNSSDDDDDSGFGFGGSSGGGDFFGGGGGSDNSSGGFGGGGDFGGPSGGDFGGPSGGDFGGGDF